MDRTQSVCLKANIFEGGRRAAFVPKIEWVAVHWSADYPHSFADSPAQLFRLIACRPLRCSGFVYFRGLVKSFRYTSYNRSKLVQSLRNFEVNIVNWFFTKEMTLLRKLFTNNLMISCSITRHWNVQIFLRTTIKSFVWTR